MTIRLLPPNLVNQIAAGEVVERPASALKELVENAIDADATHIDIVLKDGGRSLIVVTDNGCGMTPQELMVAVDRHATSKLPNDDLLEINYLGFRGEALPAIGSVARLTVTSRTPGADSGWYVVVAGGRKDGPVPAPHPPGTRTEVRDIFFATPARLKFLKSAQTELSYAINAIERLAMAHPDISFTLTADGRQRLNLPAGLTQGDLFDAHLERLALILGKDFAANALPVAAEREALKLYGYIGVPTFNRGNALAQYLFVNGRPVHDRLLAGAVRAAYQDFLAPNRHPYVVLFLELPLREADVNVHPAKAEVRFRDSGLVRSLVVGALKHALAEAGHRASTTVATGALGSFQAGGYRSLNVPPPMTFGSKGGGGYGPVYAMQTPLDEENQGLAEGDAGGSLFALAPSAPDAKPIEVVEADCRSHPLGVARAQLHETYIVAQTGDGIVIVDQHAAHERLVYERMKAALTAGGIPRQMLLIPEVIELDETSAARVAARAPELAELGLVLEAFGGHSVVVREVPALLGDSDVVAMVKDLADDLACHGAIRAGRRLNGAEMNAILRQMEVTPHAGQCNHGRPTYVELKLKDIERLFGRR
jgi:DNA mismatch repair protein MutL